mmetsp:Transcript_6678/g.13053  ORF Transcript_6678/g.13053 Transcript_6678/m.13053 type:complete len:317 (-) Transcript_6678:314-1264(-)
MLAGPWQRFRVLEIDSLASQCNLADAPCPELPSTSMPQQHQSAADHRGVLRLGEPEAAHRHRWISASDSDSDSSRSRPPAAPTLTTTPHAARARVSPRRCSPEPPPSSRSSSDLRDAGSTAISRSRSMERVPERSRSRPAREVVPVAPQRRAAGSAGEAGTDSPTSMRPSKALARNLGRGWLRDWRHILRTAMMGTERIMPTTPQSEPHSTRDSSTTIGCSSIASPSTRGSTKLPTMACTVVGIRKVSTMSMYDLVGSKTTTGMGRRVEITPPTLGMKLRRKARRPNTSARSTLSSRRASPTAMPVVTDSKTLNPM